MKEQIQRIKDKLAKLQNIGWENYKDSTGVWGHQFQMNPPLSQEQLVAFETHFDIDLPEGYRDFLFEVGNGGAGPYYGILPIERWYQWLIPYGNMSLEETVKSLEFNPHDYFSQEYAERANSLTGYGLEYKEGPSKRYGTIAISSQGCGIYCFLVVNGIERGRVFYVGDMHTPYFMPDPDFLSWYERWLDETLSGKKIGWFEGYGWPDVDRPEYWDKGWVQLEFEM